MLEINATSIHSDDARRHLHEALPALRVLDDTRAVDALVHLYDLGVQAGVESSQKAMQDIGGWLAKIVAAHVKADAAGLHAVLNAFVETHCIVTGGPAPSYTPTSTH